MRSFRYSCKSCRYIACICSSFIPYLWYSIVSYIAISVKNQYIKLSAKKSLHTTAFSDLSDSQLYFVDSSNATMLPISIEEYLPHNNKLTLWERQVVMDFFVNGLSISEIAHMHKKSRQAVNQAKNRGLNKIIAGLHK